MHTIVFQLLRSFSSSSFLSKKHAQAHTRVEQAALETAPETMLMPASQPCLHTSASFCLAEPKILQALVWCAALRFCVHRDVEHCILHKTVQGTRAVKPRLAGPECMDSEGVYEFIWRGAGGRTQGDGCCRLIKSMMSCAGRFLVGWIAQFAR